MTALRIIRLSLPAIWLAGLLALASAAPAADRDKLKAFLQVTGFDVALDSIALSASDAPRMIGMKPSDFGADWARVSQEVFDTGLMRGMALDILGQTLSDDDLAHAAEFYASPLGQRLVEVENASHMIEDNERKLAEGEALVAEAVAAGSGRAALLRRLNSAVDSSGHGVRAVQEIMVRFLLAASHAGVLDQRLDEKSLRAVIARQADEMRMSMLTNGLANAAYTYQDFTDAELEAYAEALEEPTMQKVYELMNAVQFEIMANRFEVLAGRMADMHPAQEL